MASNYSEPATLASNISKDFNDAEEAATEKVYWALIMIPLPLVAVVGNILVILSVYKEKTLQTATNYFIVSLAFADLLVAAVVMPFAVYVLVNGDWELSDMLCDFYIALDVTCSTASIFNLVAISIDRYIAVTQPIKYSKHKNTKRVFSTIAIVWLVSAAIGSPIVLGLNTSPERIPNLCVFYNSDFIIYSSLSSFYIPCIVMVYLYYKIFKAIHERTKKVIRQKIPLTPLNTRNHQKEITAEVIPKAEVEQYIMVHLETPEGVKRNLSSTANREESMNHFPGVSECSDACGRETSFSQADSKRSECKFASSVEASLRRNGTPSSLRATLLNPGEMAIDFEDASGRMDEEESQAVKQKKKRRFIFIKQKKGNKRREKNAARRERKATKTLAIVLGVFLVCWVPFFTCNILDAICIKLESDSCRPGVTAFLLTTWLGYVNSCVNPVIYTIFNAEFRKAFKKLLLETCK